jgi:hypothetical protein
MSAVTHQGVALPFKTCSLRVQLTFELILRVLALLLLRGQPVARGVRGARVLRPEAANVVRLARVPSRLKGNNGD